MSGSGSGALLNLAFVFGLFQAVSYFNLAREENLLYVRGAYIFSNLIQLVILYSVRVMIKSKNDDTQLTFTEGKKPFAEEEPETITQTFTEYDLAQLRQHFNQMLISGCIIGFIHYKWGYIPPLIMQSVMGLKNCLGFPVVSVHLLGKQAVGDLTRPWKAKTMFEPPPTPVGPKEKKAIEKKEQKKKAVGRVD